MNHWSRAGGSENDDDDASAICCISARAGGDAWNYLGDLLAAMRRPSLRDVPFVGISVSFGLGVAYSIAMHILVFPDGNDEMA